MLEWEHPFIVQHLETFKMITRLSVFLAGLFLTACASLPATLMPDSGVGTPAGPPTPTIVWFPPSATPTLRVLPTSVPTIEYKPGVGDSLLTDDFSSPALWDIAASDQASADVSRNRLTLAVQPGFKMSSLRRDIILDDFYAEITARPSLCRGKDEYGLLVRAVPAAAYRFALSCNGMERADRAGVNSTLPLQPPIPSGDVPLGAPGEVRMGVWAVGSELRFFLNGRYQFSVNDKSYASGTVGVFARPDGDTPVTVTFSDFTVYTVHYVFPTRTPKP